MTAEEFEVLTMKAQPHQVFRLDWNNYYPLDYADTFLPNVQGYKAKAFRLYDGGEFFKDLQKTERKVLAFKDSTDLNTLISYTYPKGVLAEEKKDTIQVARHEICAFLEFDQQENIDITFKFGSDFKNFVDDLYQDKKINNSSTTLENTTYNSTIENLKSNFEDGLVHDTMMRFVLNTIGIPVEDVASVAPVFSTKVFRYIEDYRVNDQYSVRILYRASQRQVLDDRPGIQPPDNSIYVWLVRNEKGEYDEGFIIIDLGIGAAKYFKEKELVTNDLSTLVTDALKDQNLHDVIEREEINERSSSSLGRAFLTVAILEDIENDPTAKEVFQSSPFSYLLLKVFGYVSSEIKEFRLENKHWDPNDKEYKPLLIPDDRIENAFLCGLINGFIDELAGISDAISFLATIMNSESEYKKFKTAIKKLLAEENLIELLVKGALKNYINSDSQERTVYQFGHDLIQIISFIIGIFQFAKSIASFASFVKKAITYLKRFGRKGLDDLKKLNNKQIENLFTTVDDSIPFDERLRRVEDLFDDLGGRKLSQKDLKLLKQKLKVEYNVDLRLIDKEVGFQKLPAVINGERKLIRSRDLLKDWNKKSRMVVGKFDEGPPPVMILRSNNATELTVFHERVHMEVWAQKLPKMNIVDEEKLVFEAIFKAKDTHKWTPDELIDSYDYVNKIIKQANRAGKNFAPLENEFIEQLKINKLFNIN